jgi:hypothetical protein
MIPHNGTTMGTVVTTLVRTLLREEDWQTMHMAMMTVMRMVIRLLKIKLATPQSLLKLL